VPEDVEVDEQPKLGRSKFWRWVIVPFLIFLFVIVTPYYSVTTTLGRTSEWYGTGRYDEVYATVLAAITVPSLIYFLIQGEKKGVSTARHLLYLLASIVANIYFGFAIWIVATKWSGLEIAAQDPRGFGLLIWWNVVDSVPLLDIDGALDWERPVEEYRAAIGWLMLIQRLVLLLTLARSAQVAVRLLTESRKADTLPPTVEEKQA
jgi:hypothetical protein